MHDDSSSAVSVPEWFSIAHAQLARPRDWTREEAVPWSMPIVLHIPKNADDKPSRNALLVAAATAVVATCLAEPAGHVDSTLYKGLDGWYGERIRKIARRARNAQWTRVQEIPGATATVNGAAARALVPTPLSDTPQQVSKLQIGGTDLPYDDPSDIVSASDTAPTLWVDRGLDMTVGKAAAQVGHASMLYAAALSAEQAWEWAQSGYSMNIREVPRSEWPVTASNGDSNESIVAVRDAGYTEIAPGSVTVVVTVRS